MILFFDVVNFVLLSLLFGFIDQYFMVNTGNGIFGRVRVVVEVEGVLVLNSWGEMFIIWKWKPRRDSYLLKLLLWNWFNIIIIINILIKMELVILNKGRVTHRKENLRIKYNVLRFWMRKRASKLHDLSKSTSLKNYLNFTFPLRSSKKFRFVVCL